MKPKVFLRKLLRGGNGITDVFNIQPLSFDDSNIDEKYISNINFNNDEIVFNEAFINTYYLHLSIFTYYYIKNKKLSKQAPDRVGFITNTVDKIKAYVKCFVLYKLLEKIKIPASSIKIINAIKSTDAFDDFDDTTINFNDKDSNLDKMSKILHAIAIIIKYGGNTNDTSLIQTLNLWSANYDNFTSVDSKELSSLNEQLSNAQSQKKSRKIEEGFIDKKSKVLDEIKKEVETKLTQLKNDFKTTYSKLKDEDKTVKLFNAAKIKQVEELAIHVIKSIRETNRDENKQKVDDYADIIIENLADNAKKSNTGFDKLFNEYDKLLKDERGDILKEIGELKDDPNNKIKASNFYKLYYEKYLKGKLLRLKPKDLLGIVTGGGNKKVKSKKGGVNDNDNDNLIIGLIKSDEFQPKDSLLLEIKSGKKITQKNFDNEKEEAEDLDKIIEIIESKSASTANEQVIKSLVKTYEILKRLEKDDDSTIFEPGDIELVYDKFQSVALNLKKVELLHEKIASEDAQKRILSGIKQDDLNKFKSTVINAIKREYNETDIKNIQDAINKLNEFKQVLADADDLIEKTEVLLKGGSKKKKKGGNDDIETKLSNIDNDYASFVEQLKENEKIIDDAMLKSNEFVSNYNTKKEEISKLDSSMTELNKDDTIKGKEDDTRHQIEKFTQDLTQKLKKEIAEINASYDSFSKSISTANQEKDYFLKNLKNNLLIIKRTKPNIEYLLAKLHQLLQKKLELIQQEIDKETAELKSVNEQLGDDSVTKELNAKLAEEESKNQALTARKKELENNLSSLNSMHEDSKNKDTKAKEELDTTIKQTTNTDINALIDGLQEVGLKKSLLDELEKQQAPVTKESLIAKYKDIDSITTNDQLRVVLRELQQIGQSDDVKNYGQEFKSILQRYYPDATDDLKEFIERLKWYLPQDGRLMNYYTDSEDTYKESDDIELSSDEIFIKTHGKYMLIKLFDYNPYLYILLEDNEVFSDVPLPPPQSPPPQSLPEEEEEDVFEEAYDEFFTDDEETEKFSEEQKNINKFKNKIYDLINSFDKINNNSNEAIKNSKLNDIDMELFAEFWAIVTAIINDIKDWYSSTYEQKSSSIQEMKNFFKDILSTDENLKIADTDKTFFENLLNYFSTRTNSRIDYGLLNGITKEEDIFDKFKYTDITSFLKDLDNTNEKYSENMKSLLLITQIFVLVVNLITQKISALKRIKIEDELIEQNIKKMEFLLRKKEQQDLALIQKEDDERIAIEEFNKKRHQLNLEKHNAKVTNNLRNKDNKANYEIEFAQKIKSEVDNYDKYLKLKDTDKFKTLFSLIQSYTAEAGEYDRINNEIRRIKSLPERLSTDEIKFLISLTSISSVRNDEFFRLKLFHDSKLKFVDLGDEQSKNKRMVTIKLNNKRMKFIKSDDGGYLEYFHFMQRVYIKLEISIELKYDYFDENKIDLEPPSTGGAYYTNEPNNIFNTYIIMVLNKIMEMNKDELAAFTDKVGIAGV